MLIKNNRKNRYFRYLTVAFLCSALTLNSLIVLAEGPFTGDPQQQNFENRGSSTTTKNAGSRKKPTAGGTSSSSKASEDTGQYYFPVGKE